VLFILFYLWVLPRMGFLAQYSPFWLFLDPVLRREITRGSFRGRRYSVPDHEDLCGWMVSRRWPEGLRHTFGSSCVRMFCNAG